MPQYHRDPAGSMIEPFLPLVREMVNQHNLSVIRILEEIRKQGYDGGHTILKEYCSAIRKDRRIPAVYRYETDPGKQLQVNFGVLGFSTRDMMEPILTSAIPN